MHIIFVRGTVGLCLPFLHSLVAHTDLRFTVVANGCDRDEERRLGNLCAANERLAFHSLNASHVLPHGDALDRLLSLERSDLFTFMDSDIFATGPVSWQDIEPAPGFVANTSCLPVWHTAHDRVMPAAYRVMGGRYVESVNGQVLGCTYLGCYRVTPLRTLIDATGASFRRREWRELDPPTRTILKQLDLIKRTYDTGKVLNLLLLHAGEKVAYRPLDALVHVGGISGPQSVRAETGSGPRRALRRLVPLRLRRAIRQRLDGIGKQEAASFVELNRRRHDALALTSELMNGPPFSARTAQLTAKDGYARELAKLFATYGAGRS